MKNTVEKRDFRKAIRQCEALANTLDDIWQADLGFRRDTDILKRVRGGLIPELKELSKRYTGYDGTSSLAGEHAWTEVQQ